MPENTSDDLVLYHYWRSGAAYRVRLALAWKGLPYQSRLIDLREGEQHAPAYGARNPQHLVPTLEHGPNTITQSTAILEYLDETFPQAPLLPATARDRAMVRAMANLIACDIHPLNNLRVLDYLRGPLAREEPQVQAWASKWIADGFKALDRLVRLYGDGYCFGNVPSLADMVLLPQFYSAARFAVDLKAFEALKAVTANLEQLEPLKAAHPDNFRPT